MRFKKIIGLSLSIITSLMSSNVIVCARESTEKALNCQEQVYSKIEENPIVSNLDKALDYIMKTQVIKSDEITLTKEFKPEDKEILAEYFSDEDVHKYFWFPSVINFESKEDVLEQWNNIDKNESLSRQNFVIKVFENVPVGILEFNYLKEKNQINLGCWIGKSFWGNQYAEKSILALVGSLHKLKPNVTFSISMGNNNENSKKAFRKGIERLSHMGVCCSLEEGLSVIDIEVVSIEKDDKNVIVEVSYKNEFFKKVTSKNKIKWHVLKNNKYQMRCLDFKIKPIYKSEEQ